MGAGLLMEYLDRSGRRARLGQYSEMAMGVLGVPHLLGVQCDRVDSRTERNNSGVGIGSDLWSPRGRVVRRGGRRFGAIWALGYDSRSTYPLRRGP